MFRKFRYGKGLLIGILITLFLVFTLLIFETIFYPFIAIRSNCEKESFRSYSLFAPIKDDLGREFSRPNKIYLIDMNGKIVHTWQVLNAVQLVKLKPDGNLIYSTRDRSFKERAGIREIDPFGNVIWYFKCWIDHDFHIMGNGNILLHYIEDIEAPSVGPGKIRCPRIIELNPNKDIIWEWRGEDHLDELTKLLGIAFPLNNEGQQILDWAHNNTCRVIEEVNPRIKDTRFKPGNIIFSYCNLNTIGVIDKDTGQIVWAWGSQDLDGQHDPKMLKNGNLLIFDNGTERGYSRVIELDPVFEKIVWEYNDIQSRNPQFFSKYLSGVQSLSNENIFICQGEYLQNNLVNKLSRTIYQAFVKKVKSSRLLEINRDKKIVWECIINDKGKDLHGIYQSTKYSVRYVRPLLEKIKESEELIKLKSLPYIR